MFVLRPHRRRSSALRLCLNVVGLLAVVELVRARTAVSGATAAIIDAHHQERHPTETFSEADYWPWEVAEQAAPSGPQNYVQALAGAASPAGALVKQTQRLLAGSLGSSPIGSLIAGKLSARTLRGYVAPRGTRLPMVPAGVHGGGGFNGVTPDPNTVGAFWSWTDVGGPSYTTSYGQRWIPRKAGILSRQNSGFSSLWIDPGDSTHLVALCGVFDNPNDFGTNGGIVESSDTGQTWTIRATNVCGGANGNLPSEAGGPRSVGSLIVKIGTRWYVGSIGTSGTTQGIWRSGASDLTSWSAFALAGEYVRCVVLDPSDATAFLVCLAFKSGSGNYGIRRVTTAGVVTTLNTGLPSNTTAEELAICATCGAWYVTMQGAGVYVSTDNGATWAATAGNSSLSSSSEWAPIAVQHNSGTGKDELLVGCTAPQSVGGGQFGSIFRSLDSGATWACVTADSTKISSLLYGSTETWWESLDSFGQTKVLGESGSTVHGIAWDPNDPDTALIATQGGPWITRNARAASATDVAWTVAAREATITKHRDGAVSPKDWRIALFMSDDWTQFFTANGGQSIDQGDVNGQGAWGAASIASDGTYYVALGNGPSVFSGTDPTNHSGWTDLSYSGTIAIDALLDGIDGGGKIVLMAGTTGADARRRFWNGSAYAWEQVSTTSFKRLAWPAPRTGAVLYALGTAAIYKSIDYGHSWFTFWTHSFTNIIGFAADSAGHLYVATSSTTWILGGQTPTGNADLADSSKTVDSGDVTATTLSAFAGLECLTVDPANGILWGITAPVSGTGCSLLFSQDFGASAIDDSSADFRAGLTAPLCMFAQAGALYVGTDGQGLYVRAPSVSKLTAHGIAGGTGSSPAGALVKQDQRRLTGSLGATSPSGALTKRTNRALAGASSPAGALVKQTRRLLAGATSPSGVLAASKVALKSLAGATSPSGVLAKLTSRLLAGASSPAGSLATATSYFRRPSGAIGPSGQLRRQTQKPLAGSSSPAGALSKQTSRRFTGSISPVGAVANLFIAALRVIEFVARAISDGIRAFESSSDAAGRGVTTDLTSRESGPDSTGRARGPDS